MPIAFVQYKYYTRPGEASAFISSSCNDRLFRGHHAYPKLSELSDYYYFDQTPHERNIYTIGEADILNFISSQTVPQLSTLLKDRCKGLTANPRKPRELLNALNQLNTSYNESSFEKGSVDRLKSRVANRYKIWLAYLFEVSFITLIIAFLLRPHRDIKSSISLPRIAIFPFLFLLPHFFGYAQDLYSTLTPGGFLYTLVIMALGIPIMLCQIGFLIPANNVIYSLLPQSLGLLHADRGEWASMSGGGGLPIIETILICLLIYLAGSAMRWLRSKYH